MKDKTKEVLKWTLSPILFSIIIAILFIMYNSFTYGAKGNEEDIVEGVRVLFNSAIIIVGGLVAGFICLLISLKKK